MAQINEWLSVDRASGEGDTTITLTASSSTELNDRIASLEIRGITKSVYMNVRQRAYVEPDTNAYFWVKLESDGEISGIKINTIEYSFNQTNWSSFTANGSISVPANTYVWFRNTSNIFNHNTSGFSSASSFLFSVKGSVGGDLSSLGSMMDYNFQYLFANGASWNTKLVDASQLILPWDVLGERCFFNMFNKCNVLTSAPELPATTLAKDCYNLMFYECVALLTAPSLPATTLTESCYHSMFQGCRKLTTAPSLPATTLAEYCYEAMFYDCTSLIETPYLPATLISTNAYHEMFRGCTSLTTISRIETPNFSNASGMFRDCTSLTEWVVEEWVVNMDADGIFQGCTKLKKITAKPRIAPSIEPNTLYGTFYGIAENGVLYIPIGSDYSAWLSTESYYLGYYGWTAEPNPEQPNNDYFWVEMLENGRIKLVNEVDSTLEYSTDTITWTPLTYKMVGTYFNGGQKVYIRNTSPVLNGGVNMLDYNKHYILNFTADCNIGGNLSSLGDMTERNFQRLFSVDGGSSYLKDASQLILPWDELSDGCFIEMFGVNRGLTAPPQLPATTLANNCYSGMFYFCENLQVAPVLPATTLTDACYSIMFGYCARLRDVKCYATNIDAEDALSNWLLAVSYTGNFTKVEGVTYPIGDSGIPQGWVVYEVANKPTDPELPTDIENCFYIEPADSSYNGTYTIWSADDINENYGWDKIRFYYYQDNTWKEFRCKKSLNELNYLSVSGRVYIKDYYRNINISDWRPLNCSIEFNVGGDITTLLGTIENPIEPHDVYGEGKGKYYAYGLFRNSNIYSAKELIFPNKTDEACYSFMFGECSKLVFPPDELPATELAEGCYSNMFSNCTSLTTAPELPATILAKECYRWMFSNCTSLTTAPVLPATTLSKWCYVGMFIKCSNLSRVECHAEVINADDYCFGDWLVDVSPTGIFIKKQGVTYPSTNSTINGDGGIPRGWTIQEIT